MKGDVMKIQRREGFELALFTVLCAVLTVIAILIKHPRMPLMVFLSLVMLFLCFAARFKHARKIRTLQGKGHRKTGEE